MRRLLFPFLLACFSWLQAGATGDSLNYLTPKDTIFLKVDDYGNKLFSHQMEDGQTLYSLARFYGLKISSLLGYNSHLDPEMGFSPGTFINVPIPDTCIIRSHDFEMALRDYVPVRYVVKPGDTFYRISKHFFNVNVDTLKSWNHLDNTMLSTGMQLHIGYMSLAGIPDALQLSNVDPMAAKLLSLRQQYEHNMMLAEPAFQNGAAYWQREKTGKADFYCLHRHAPVGSVILIKNPMRNKSIYAKVIAPIPDRAYGDDIIVVLSPSVAKSLGARDPKFYVELSYFN